MFKKLRIICCIVAVIITAGAIFIGIYLGTVYGLIAIAVAAIFAGLMFLFKKKQEEQENKTTPPSHGDFITGPAHHESNDSTAASTPAPCGPEDKVTASDTAYPDDNQNPVK